MSLEAERQRDIDAIRSLRQPVDDQSVADAAERIGAEQLTRWAEQTVCLLFQLRTMDDKVPWMTAADGLAILLAAFEWQVELEKRP